MENICRLAVASETNLPCMIKLCLASELPTVSATCEAQEHAAKQATKQQLSQLPSVATYGTNPLLSTETPGARCVAETIRRLYSQSGKNPKT